MAYMSEDTQSNLSSAKPVFVMQASQNISKDNSYLV